MKRNVFIQAAAALAMAAGAAMAADNGAEYPAATRELMRMYPGVQVAWDQGRIRTIYGEPMTPGLTPANAAALWLAQHSGAFGIQNLDLRPTWSSELGNGRHTVFAYQQFMGGLPVEYGNARILVLKGPANRVVYAAGTLAPSPAQAFPEIKISAERAVSIVKGFKQYTKLPVFSDPELVVYQGEGGWIEPARTWKFVAEEPDLNRRERWTFFVDASTGTLIHVRNEVLNDDVTGSTQGKATPGLFPDETTNAPVLMNLPQLRVTISGGSTAYSDNSGVFTLPTPGTDPVTLDSQLGTGAGAGRWVSVRNQSGTTLSLSQPGTPGTPVTNYIYNLSPGGANSLTTAQVNGYIHTNVIHDYYRTRSGTWDLNDSSFPCNVNLNQTCNAFFDGTSINFFKNGGGCPNTAYSDVVGHEYGHWIVSLLGLGQGGFGEGFADSGAILQYDGSGILGRDFLGPGQPVRNVVAANQQYPCSDPDPHVCGQILGGVWYGIRQKMGTRYGNPLGLERTRQLEVDWMQITIGGTGSNFSNSANPTTAIEILTINDDDGRLSNGTPNYAQICPPFVSHGVTCPTAPPLGFEFPAGLPDHIQPNTTTDVLVNVFEMARVPADNTGKFFYRTTRGGTFTQVNMTRLAANQYKATFPSVACDTNFDYYFTAGTTGSPPVTAVNPTTAPNLAYDVPAAFQLDSVFADDFEADRGWSGSVPDDDAVTGRWTRDIPQATAAQPGSDHSPAGVKCWVTDYHAGQQVSDFDVDGGKTTLTSPLLNLAGRLSPRISFWLWYSNDVGPVNPNTNVFRVDVSNNDGISWITALTVGPTGDDTDGGWLKHSFRLGDFVEPTGQVRVRFVASDYTNAIVEAAVDDFAVTASNCTPPPPPPCYANCDGSVVPPVLNVSDFLCFLNKYAANDSYANCDGSTVAPILNVSDFTCFLNKYAQGCP